VEIAEEEGDSGNADFAPSNVALCISISAGLEDGVNHVDDIGAAGKQHPPLLLVHNELNTGSQPIERSINMLVRARETGILSRLITVPGEGNGVGNPPQPRSSYSNLSLQRNL
jgi:hypothetical protein